jgi:hypothetical protein
MSQVLPIILDVSILDRVPFHYMAPTPGLRMGYIAEDGPYQHLIRTIVVLSFFLCALRVGITLKRDRQASTESLVKGLITQLCLAILFLGFERVYLGPSSNVACTPITDLASA